MKPLLGGELLIVTSGGEQAAALERRLAGVVGGARVTSSLNAALDAMRKGGTDVCLLDIGLPGGEAWKLLRIARDEPLSCPIIVFSASEDEGDRVLSFSLGAEAFVQAKATRKTLTAAIRAAIRAPSRPAQGIHEREITVEELRLVPPEMEAFVDGNPSRVTPTEFRLLYALAQNRDVPRRREELLAEVWGRAMTPRNRTVDVTIRQIRGKVDRISSRHSFVQTIPGGYVFRPQRKMVPGLDD